MKSYVLTASARRELEAIWFHIAADSPRNANRVEEAIYRTCGFVSEHPQLGHTRREVTSDSVRFTSVSRFPKYLVVYQPDTKPLRIVAIIHGARDLAARFG